MRFCPCGVRERIVGMAERIFLRSGFSRVLMDDLARELGMSKKTLYSHFASKEELLRAVLLQRTREVDEGLEAIVSAKESFPAEAGASCPVSAEQDGGSEPGIFGGHPAVCAGVFSGGGGVSRAGDSPLFWAIV